MRAGFLFLAEASQCRPFCPLYKSMSTTETHTHLRLVRRLCHGHDHGAHLEWLPSSLGLVDKLHVVQASTDVSGENIDDLNSQVTAMCEISKLPA